MFQGKGNLAYVKAVNVRGRREHNGVIMREWRRERMRRERERR